MTKPKTGEIKLLEKMPWLCHEFSPPAGGTKKITSAEPQRNQRARQRMLGQSPLSRRRRK